MNLPELVESLEGHVCTSLLSLLGVKGIQLFKYI